MYKRNIKNYTVTRVSYRSWVAGIQASGSMIAGLLLHGRRSSSRTVERLHQLTHSLGAVTVCNGLSEQKGNKKGQKSRREYYEEPSVMGK
jgi:hypothetical protein